MITVRLGSNDPNNKKGDANNNNNGFLVTYAVICDAAKGWHLFAPGKSTPCDDMRWQWLLLITNFQSKRHICICTWWPMVTRQWLGLRHAMLCDVMTCNDRHVHAIM